MRQFAIRAGAGLVLALSSPAMANQEYDNWARMVQEMLDGSVRFFNERGYHYSGYSHRGWLADDERESSTFSLTSGVPTVFNAGCDTDCSDIDIVVRDPAGQEVIADRDADDTPTVYFTPAQSGDYSVTVIMATCTAGPCFYLLGEYRR